MTKQKLIRICGVLAILGGIINGIGDLMLIVGPFPGNYGFMTMATHIPFEMSLAGSILGGAIGIPMWMFLLFPLYYAVKPAGNCFAIPIMLLIGHMIIICAVIHSACALYHAAYYALANVGAESKPVLEGLIAQFGMFETTMKLSFMVTCVAGSLWLIVGIVSGKTLYKRWMSIFTPLLVIAIHFVSNRLPAPIGGYFAPYDGTLMFTLFFLVTTIATWNYQESS